MAKNKGAIVPQAPQGFDINVGRAESKGWIAREPGVEVTASILGRYEYLRKGKTAAFYQLKLIEGCLVYPNSEDVEGFDPESDELPAAIEMPEGTVVNVGEIAGLRDLKTAIDIINRGGAASVWFAYKGKEPNRNTEGDRWVLHGPKLRIDKQPKAD